jgi:pimeloyl-ACP methyl ester carboxylesterase
MHLSDAAARTAAGKTFVLAHGSWHGGWCWTRVADRLRAQGHRVFTPSYTGMGDRAHLLTKDITLDTFIEDISRVLLTEELSEVTLVGHSFGGVPITGVADRLPERIRHLVYLDGVVLESGKSAFASYPPEESAQRFASAEASGGLAVPAPQRLPASWGLSEGSADYAWVMHRLSPTPLRVYTTPLMLRAPIGNGRPRTYIHCIQPENPAMEASRLLVKTLQGWNWMDFTGPHDCMITHPNELATLLLQI